MTGMSNVTKLAGEPSGQEFLVFTLGDEEYGIDILKVQEIRGYDRGNAHCEHASVYQGCDQPARCDCAYRGPAREIQPGAMWSTTITRW